MDLLSMLLGSMTSDDSVDSLKKKTGSSGKQVKLLIALAIPLLIKFLTKNASKKEGATSLMGALAQHTNTNNMSNQISTADEADGAAILAHILGNNNSSVVNTLSQQTGMTAAQVQQALNSMAPGLLSGLSAATTQAQQAQKPDSFDLSDLMGMFGGSKPQQSGGLLSSLLGGAAKPQQSSGLDILSSLLGGNDKDDESMFNGSSLLSSLLSLGR